MIDFAEVFEIPESVGVSNLSGLHPLGHCLLVEPATATIGNGTIAIPDHVRANMSLIEMRATVIELGPECWPDEKQARARPGDKVLMAKFAGHAATGDDGKQYRLVNDRDIFCRLEK